ncbi:hypothetical protein Tco_0803697 [Tanacetum coccineum]|uniref:Polyprotein n=1 Tax=Tanacetum coccineum TaxID=301880 RepID=A0ABQ5A2B1_9ASTR
MLDFRGFIPLMTPTQALKSVQVMAYYSHNWYDETTTRKKINNSPNNVDTIQASFKGEHLTKECPFKKEDKRVEQNWDDEWIRTSIENMDSNIRALKTTTKNLHEKAYQLTQTVLTNTREKFKARTTMGKENMKERVPRDLPPMPFLGHVKEQIGSPYRTCKTVCMIENPREIHKMKAQEDEGDRDIGWDIIVKDEKIIMEEEQDYEISLNDGVMQPLAPQTVHITPPNDDYVAPATNPILDKQLNEFRKEFSDITRVAKKENCNPVNNVKELSDIKKYDCETFFGNYFTK